MLVEKYAVLVHGKVYFVTSDKVSAKSKKNIFGESAVLRIYYGNPEDNTAGDYFTHKKQGKRAQAKDVKQATNAQLQDLADLFHGVKNKKVS